MIGAWNVNSARRRKNEILELLERAEMAVMALQETRLSEEKKFMIAGYDVYRNDRNTQG